MVFINVPPCHLPQAAVRRALGAALKGSGASRRLLPLPRSFELLCFTFAVGGGSSRGQQQDAGGGGDESVWLLRVDPALAETNCSAAEAIFSSEGSDKAAVLEGVLLGLSKVTARGSITGDGDGHHQGTGAFEPVGWVRGGGGGRIAGPAVGAAVTAAGGRGDE